MVTETLSDLHGNTKRQLFATEYGSSGRDKVNIIEAGENYGWPIICGGEIATGLKSPLIHSDEDTWAPSGVSYLDGSLYFGGLCGQSLYEITLDEDTGRLALVFFADEEDMYQLREHLHGYEGEEEELY